MEKTGLVYSIIAATANIDYGRKGFATRGKAEEGRIFYEDGIAEAKLAFKEASTTNVAATTADPHTTTLAEYTFLTQELEFCPKTDKDSFNSLILAIQSLDDAFTVLGIVDDKAIYQGVEKSYPHHKKHRIKGGYPKDAFHIAMLSHKTRLQNILRSPGIDPLEKDLLKQRIANLTTARKAYVEKQKKALTNEK